MIRNLAEFRNADGQAPSGCDDGRDDSLAFRRALDAGPGVIQVGPGYYRCGQVAIPSGVSLVGAGHATVIRTNGSGPLFQQVDVGHWVLRDLVLDGEAQGDWHGRRDEGRHGIVVTGCWGYEMAGVTVRNFCGAGIQIAATNLAPGKAPFCNGGNLDRITTTGNHIGIRFDRRAEYLNATAISAFQNVTGGVIHAGNVKLAASNFCNNIDGLLIEDKENGSHGAIVNCLVNHNERHALWIRNVANGMAIANCCFFYGDIRIENSVGVNVTGSEICCNLTIAGQGVNRIAGNYVIPCAIASEFRLAQATIVQDNFTDQGAWAMNSAAR